MKKKILYIAIASALTLASQPSIAAKDGASNGDNNGVPFQEINQLISENRTLIENNQAAIIDLNTDVAAINLHMGTIESDLADISTKVSNNTVAISDAFQRILDAEADITELGDLASQHNADMQALQSRLDGIEADISDLAIEGAALAATLDDRVTELRGLIDNNAIGIDALLADILLINTQLTTINSNYNLLSSQQADLITQMSDYAEQLSNLDAALSALKASGYNYDVCLETVLVGQSIAGELVNDGECTSDSRNNNGEHGARYYTFTISGQQTVQVDMEGLQNGQGSLSDPYLYLHSGGRDGSVITYDDDGGYSINARITRTLQPGTYTIETTSYRDTQYGTFRLTVQ